MFLTHCEIKSINNKYMEKFGLIHLALYSKGFYKKSDDIISDLRKCFMADNYAGDVMDITDMCYVALSQFQKIDKRECRDLISYTDGISPANCYRNGYYTKQNIRNSFRKIDADKLPDYDIRIAVLYYVISTIRYLTFKEMGIDEIVRPDFKKCLPRPNGLKNKELERMFG